MIETKVQANRLRRLGIDLGQGYFFGKPASTLVEPGNRRIITSAAPG
jgi:EAL domain-containing protein (putative c-di-GMP-specific phosphodiesterase class I)